MSELTINELPNEIINKILRFLRQEDLMNATLTCKLWSNLIESSCRWSLELYHNNEVGVNEPWIDFMLSTNRKFGSITLNMIMDIDSNRTLEIFQKHGFSVTRLCLMGSCIDSFIKFAAVLKCMPNLTDAIMFETSTLCGVNDAPPTHDLPDLRKLKTLEMIGSEYSIVKCFEKAKLTTIKVLNSYCEHSFSFDCVAFEEFLKSQETLTTLALRSVHHDTSMLFQTKALDCMMPFHLTRLSLLNIRLQESPNDYNNMLKFLQTQAKTLKELELGRHFPNFVYEFVFANMTKLRTLSLMMTEIPKDKEFYERLEEHQSIRNLIFLDSDRINDKINQFFINFLKKLPNVHSLNVLGYCGNEAFTLLAQNLPKVEFLAMYSFNESVFHGVTFPNLKTLQIHELDDKIDWNEFTKANSRLTELTIESIYDEAFLTSEDMENVTANLSLRCLRLGDNFSADKRFFEILRKNCPELALLDLHMSCIPAEPKDRTNCTNVLRLCGDDVIKCSKYATIWNEHDYGGRRAVR